MTWSTHSVNNRIRVDQARIRYRITCLFRNSDVHKEFGQKIRTKFFGPPSSEKDDDQEKKTSSSVSEQFLSRPETRWPKQKIPKNNFGIKVSDNENEFFKTEWKLFAPGFEPVTLKLCFFPFNDGRWQALQPDCSSSNPVLRPVHQSTGLWKRLVSLKVFSIKKPLEITLAKSFLSTTSLTAVK